MSKAKQDQMWAQQRAYFDELSRWFPVDKSGDKIEPGTEMLSFRNEVWIFVKVTAFPTYGKTGKVLVRDPNLAEGEPMAQREFYPSVFDLELRREAQGN
jgi:hypothetical protein